MSALSPCPFCHYEVVPARGSTGALVCPLCRNTGKTERLDSAGLRRALDGFERRVVAHLGDVQAVVSRLAHERPDRTVDNKADAEEVESEERLTHIESRLDEMDTRHEAHEAAVSIRLAELASQGNLDDLIRSVEALNADIRDLHRAYERADVPALRQELRALARSVRDLEEQQHGRRQTATAEWQRPEPETLDEADTPVVRARFVVAHEEPHNGHGQGNREEALVAPAAAANGGAPGRRPPADDFSDVPPVMDGDTPSMRDLVARDAVRMPESHRRPETAGQDPLDGIESALHDIDARLRRLRDR